MTKISASKRANDGEIERKARGDAQKRTASPKEHPPPARKSNDDAIVISFRIPRPVFWSCAVLIAGLSLIIVPYTFYTGYLKDKLFKNALEQQVGADGVMLFYRYDRNNDGYISLEEFEPLSDVLYNTNTTTDYPLILEEDDEVVTVRSSFTPLDISTMTKDVYDEFVGSLTTLNGLKTWKSTNIQWQNIGASHFKFFFPSDDWYLHRVGEVYDILNQKSDSLFNQQLSSNRYYPPVVLHEEVLLHRLLAMFHPKPFLYTRFEPRGSVACVRAYNDDYIEIIFRVHAEFQLNEPPYLPFWFTPGQFTGHVIMSHDGSKLLDFDMYVPANRSLNVDMEWFTDSSETNNMEVDIGYMADMSLKTFSASQKIQGPASYKTSAQLPVDDEHELVLQDLRWTHEISLTTAVKNLEVKLFPFKQAVYEDFSSAYARAEDEKRLVHLILLWGALDDQSC